MFIQKNENFFVRRRDFLKTSALAGLTIALPHINLFATDPEVINSWYEKLADALNQLPNAYPRTQSNIEITLLKKIFLPEEANMAGQLTKDSESVSEIAKRTGLSEEETDTRLRTMAGRGLVWGNPEANMYRLAPFVVGIYESQMVRMDHELAHLVEEYFQQSGFQLMKYQPALHRVIPAHGTVKTEWILPYDKLVELMNSCNTFRVNDCICRKQQDLLGKRKCTFPLHVELIFYTGNVTSDPPVPPFVTREEALAVLQKTEKIGLVHTVSNVAEGVHYVCNCCGCCCGILRGITEAGIKNSVAAANYYSEVYPEKCVGCGNCIKRCHMKAITSIDGVSVVDRTKCIGCGLCATGCASQAAVIKLKPENEIIHPPKDIATWEHERLMSRGLI